MKAMILAAGLGTRLKPWTERHPKALVPVNGVPMLERVIGRLKDSGFDEIVVNIHHFADQIEEFLDSKEWGVRISISNEREKLLDTGGALLHARDLLTHIDWEPFLVHNVDILSNIDLGAMMKRHKESGADVTLAVGKRKSDRELVFGSDMRLRGWRNVKTRETRPEGFEAAPDDTGYPFSGIYVASVRLLEEMQREKATEDRFPIIDFLLNAETLDRKGYPVPDLKLLDIGKPDTLERASEFLSTLGRQTGRIPE